MRLRYGFAPAGPGGLESDHALLKRGEHGAGMARVSPVDAGHSAMSGAVEALSGRSEKIYGRSARAGSSRCGVNR
jgi:hypothetical protein